MLLGGLLTGAILIGSASAYGAFVFSPLLVPAAVALTFIAVVSVSRPEVGIAAAFLMVPIGNLGLAGARSWLPVTAWSAYLFSVAAYELAWSPQEARKLPRMSLALSIYLGVAMLGVLVTKDTADAQPIIRSLLTGLLLFFAIAVTIRRRSQVHWVLGGIAAGALVTGLFAIYQDAAGFSASEGFYTGSGELVNRITAGFPHPNSLGGFLLMLSPFLIAGALLQRRLAPYYVAVLVITVAGVYLSFSRGALVGLAIVPLFFLRGRMALLMVPLLIGGISFATPDLVRERFATLSHSGSEFATREDIWTTAGHVWTENPVLGVGIGGFPDAYGAARIPGKQFLPTTAFGPPPHAHNIVLHHLAEQGVVGLLAFLGVLGVALHASLSLRRSKDWWYWVMGSAGLAWVFAFLLHNMFDVTPLEGTGVYFWALLGLLSAVTSMLESQGASASDG